MSKKTEVNKMKCKMEKKVNAYLEKELAKNEYMLVQKHLQSCSECQKTLRELLQANDFLSNFNEQDVPVFVIDSILKRTNQASEPVVTKRAVNFGFAAAILLSFLSGLWISEKVFSQPDSSSQLVEIGAETLFSHIVWED
jgi:anti-sigma factor RsiW